MGDGEQQGPLTKTLEIPLSQLAQWKTLNPVEEFEQTTAQKEVPESRPSAAQGEPSNSSTAPNTSNSSTVNNNPAASCTVNNVGPGNNASSTSTVTRGEIARLGGELDRLQAQRKAAEQESLRKTEDARRNARPGAQEQFEMKAINALNLEPAVTWHPGRYEERLWYGTNNITIL